MTFLDLETMVSTLSPKRLALLRHVRQHPAENIAVLAKSLGRDYKRVHEDVATLVHTGLLERDAQGIRAPYDSVHTEVSLYVKRLAAAANADGTEPMSLNTSWAQWQADGRAFWQQMDALVETLDGLDRT